MSAHAGIYALEQPLDRLERLDRLAAGLHRLGPDGEGRAQGRHVAMVFRPFYTNTESRNETQPLSLAGGVFLTWDGRLDNRSELIAELDIRKRQEGVITDPEIVAHAYKKWGVDFLRHVVGDFALALTDEKANRLLLARDPFGLRPLFYYRTNRELIWSASLGSLLNLDEISPAIDEEFVANYLTHPTLSELTPYKDLKAVKPANYVLIERGVFKSAPYWDYEIKNPTNYRDDREYEDHFRFLFRESINSRLRTDGLVFSELSGGLDSSSIICVADTITGNGSPRPPVHTISYIYDESRSSNEQSFVSIVEEHRNVQGTHIRERELGILKCFGSGADVDFPHPEYMVAHRNDRVAKLIQAKGGRVLLRGVGGDQVLWGEYPVPFELADHLARSDVKELLKSLRTWSQTDRTSAVRLLWQAAILPVSPMWLKARFSTLRPLPIWLSPHFIQKWNLKERRLGPAERHRDYLPSQREQIRILENVSIGASWGFPVLDDFIEVSLPFLDRRLVEYCLGIPFEQKLRPKETRSILRRALNADLPREIAQRKFKQGPTEALFRAVAREWRQIEEILSRPRVCEHGFADRDAFRDVLKRAKHGIGGDIFSLTKLLSLELWLRSLEARSRDGNPKLRAA